MRQRVLAKIGALADVTWKRACLAAACAFVIFLLLEVYRPYYFLTDDNLDAGLPSLVQMGRRMVAGKSPLIVDGIFGGDYPAWRDPSFLSCWHPLPLAATLLGATPFWAATIDILSLAHLLICTVAASLLVSRIEVYAGLPRGHWPRHLFIVLGYTYCFYHIIVSSSWGTFLANGAALPLIVLGLLQRRLWVGILIVAGAQHYGLLAGHVSPWLFAAAVIGIFSACLSLLTRDLKPVLIFTAGTLAALVVASPFLYPAFGGYVQSPRTGLVIRASEFRVPFATLIPSYFLGAFAIFGPPFSMYLLPPIWAYAIAYSPSTLLLPWIGRVWRQHRGLASSAGVLVLLSALLVARPDWMQDIMEKAPIYSSLRWPFREIILIHIGSLILLGLGAHTLTDRRFWTYAGAGLALVILPVISAPAPANWAMEMDRQLIISGEANKFWDEVKQRGYLQKGDVFTTIMVCDTFWGHRHTIPFSLLAIFDYGGLFGVTNASGYSVTLPKDAEYVHQKVDVWKGHAPMQLGFFEPDAREALLKERPNLKFLVLESADPLVIRLEDPSRGKSYDLTPLIPAWVKEKKMYPDYWVPDK